MRDFNPDKKNFAVRIFKGGDLLAFIFYTEGIIHFAVCFDFKGIANRTFKAGLEFWISLAFW